MKVKNINVSSINTREKIKKSFAELLYEKHELQKITVTELVKRVGITRSSFYTHYESIYDVAKEFQDDTAAFLFNDNVVINDVNDIYNYIDNLTDHIKRNEDIYRMLISSNDQLYFFDKIRKLFVSKACVALKGMDSDEFFELKMNFFIDGVVSQLIKYFRKDFYSLDVLNKNTKEWFNCLFIK